MEHEDCGLSYECSNFDTNFCANCTNNAKSEAGDYFRELDKLKGDE